MKERINCMKRNKELINYIIMGILTTGVNVGSYFALTESGLLNYQAATVIAWIISVLFAYVTNKKYVFSSKTSSFRELRKEISSFFFFRVLSLGIDFISMVILIELLQMEDFLAKVISNVIVIAFNYVASKQIIFKKQLQ
ncbi:putative flippase GtrA [Planomicrobium sp. HSC-17F08]|nr:putative flippase GtrA [Planomicrobium sp. HSC-17F08]